MYSSQIRDTSKTTAKTINPPETVSSFKNTNKSSNVADKYNNTGDKMMMKLSSK